MWIAILEFLGRLVSPVAKWFERRRLASESKADHDRRKFEGADRVLGEEDLMHQLAGLKSTLRCDSRGIKKLWDFAAYLNRAENSFLNSTIRAKSESTAESFYTLLLFIDANFIMRNARSSELLKLDRPREDPEADQALMKSLRKKADEVASEFIQLRSTAKTELHI